MKDGEGVTEIYSRLSLITNEITRLGNNEITNRFIVKKILRALDSKYDTICTLLQMMPNFKDLKPTEVVGRIVAHEMSLKDKDELHCASPHQKSSGAYKDAIDSSKLPSEEALKDVSNEEIALMVRNFRKMYKKNKFKFNVFKH